MFKENDTNVGPKVAAETLVACLTDASIKLPATSVKAPDSTFKYVEVTEVPVDLVAKNKITSLNTRPNAIIDV
jgi:hypothetical protein